jgi:hypothetical protein
MALHRDIFWVGRQWAVTGFGLQAVDQRLRGVFDIAVDRLWDNDLVARRRGMPGVNAEDFDKALAVARTRFPEPGAAPAQPEPSRAPEPAPVAPLATPPPGSLVLRAEGRLARFVPQWRIRR